MAVKLYFVHYVNKKKEKCNSAHFLEKDLIVVVELHRYIHVYVSKYIYIVVRSI